MAKVVQEAGASFVCFQETKLSAVTLNLIKECAGPSFDGFYFLPADGTRGGVLVAWNSRDLRVSNPHVMEFSVTVHVQGSDDSNPGWWFTGVYGPQDVVAKVSFLQELQDVRDLHAWPWMLAGDFNLISDPADKNNTNINRRMMGKFRKALRELELSELYLNGRTYTWSNERAQPTL